MLISTSKIKRETEKAFLIFSKRGPFHEVRQVNGRSLVCKIFYKVEKWVPKSLCTIQTNGVNVPDSFLIETEQIVP